MSNDFDVVKHGEIHKPSYLHALWEVENLIRELRYQYNEKYLALSDARNLDNEIDKLIDNCK